MKTYSSRQPGATVAGIFSLALCSVVLLCGAGLTPAGNVQTSDLNANGYSITNAATVSATNFVGPLNGSATNVTGIVAVDHGGTGTDSPSLVAGTNVTIFGTWPNQTINASSGSQSWELKSSDFTAVAGHRYQVDTSGGAVTVTLPASATAMDEIEVADASLSWNTRNVTLNRNGLKINNGTSNYTASVQGNKLSVVYISSGFGWSIK